MDQQDNITIRRAHTHLDITRNVSNMSIDALDVTTNSLPDISIDDELQTLLQKIEQLQIQLKSAHEEIEELSLQNRKLSKTNMELTKKNVLYKKIGNSPAKFLSPNLSTSRNNAKQQQKQKHHKETQTEGKILKETEIISSKKSHKETQTNTEIAKQTTPRKEKETQTYFTPTMGKSKNQGSNLHPSTSLNTRVNSTPPVPIQKCNKICLISSQKSYNLQHKTIIENEQINRYDICHHRKPVCGILPLLEGIENKLKKFTMQDFCIIFLGEEDFLSTNNNLELVMYIREQLLKVLFTNIIICLPTFKCHKYATMFNWRIENFNNLLYIDNESKQYAYLLDTNLNLTYDHRMFSKLNGIVNIHGLRIILHDLGKLTKRIAETISYTSSMNEEPTDKQEQNELQFFLE